MQLQQQQQQHQQQPQHHHTTFKGATRTYNTSSQAEFSSRPSNVKCAGSPPPPPPAAYLRAALAACRLLHMHYTRLCLKPARLVGPGRDPSRDRRLASCLTPPSAAVQLLPQPRPGQAAARRGAPVGKGTAALGAGRAATGSGGAQCAAEQRFAPHGGSAVQRLEAACMAALSSHGLGAVRACDGAGGCYVVQR